MQKQKDECACACVCSHVGERWREVKTFDWSGMSEGAPAILRARTGVISRNHF